MAPDPLAAAVDEIAALKAERANDRELIGQLYGRIEELKGHLYRAVIELEELSKNHG